jgi:hypothetical protein
MLGLGLDYKDLYLYLSLAKVSSHQGLFSVLVSKNNIFIVYTYTCVLLRQLIWPDESRTVLLNL